MKTQGAVKVWFYSILNLGVRCGELLTPLAGRFKTLLFFFATISVEFNYSWRNCDL